MTNGAVGEPSRESLYRGYSVAAPQNLSNNGAPHFFVDVKTTESTLEGILYRFSCPRFHGFDEMY